jgi:hypothetical protein
MGVLLTHPVIPAKAGIPLPVELPMEEAGFPLSRE